MVSTNFALISCVIFLLAIINTGKFSTFIRKLFYVLIFLGSSLRCYTCHSYVDGKCGKGFKANETLITNCSEAIDVPNVPNIKYQCMTITFNGICPQLLLFLFHYLLPFISGTIGRTCGIKMNGYDPCKSVETSAGVKIKCNLCDSDLCNSAKTATVLSAMLLISFIIIKIIG